MSLTPWDQDLLVALTGRVRLFAETQIVRSAWGGTILSEQTTLKRVRCLESSGWLLRLRLPAHPELELRSPISIWRPSLPAPHFGAVSYALKNRWRLPLQDAGIVVATRKAAKLFGGSPGWVKNSSQVTHDLHVSSLFLHYRKRLSPGFEWVGEDQLTKERGKKHPDALIIDGAGRPRLFVEFGGSYAVERVEKLHRHCAAAALPYELW